MSTPNRKPTIVYMTTDDLKAWQARNRLNNRELGTFLGVTASAVDFWRNGRNPVDRRTWLVLSLYDGDAAAIRKELAVAIADLEASEVTQ